MTGIELEILGELEDELEREASELEILAVPKGAAARRCDSRGIPPIEPAQAL